MIEAINCCNSIHGTGNILQPNGSYKKVLVPNAKLQTISSDAKKMVTVGACSGAISMITDTLLNANELVKNNFSVVKGIVKNAAIWGIIGGLCYGAFRLMEVALIKKPKTS